MVRLKDGQATQSPATDLHFNSSMVRLKAAIKHIVGAFMPYFNSSMVRLKDTSSIQQRKRYIFQFLNGAIKRTCAISIGLLGIKFQFLNGAIKSSFTFSVSVCIVVFQFLNGAIKSRKEKLYLMWAKQFQFLNGAIKSLFTQNGLPTL